MSMHRVFLDQSLANIAPGSLLRVAGDQAKHALRVKRLEAGDPIELLDGRGHLAPARLENSGKASRDDWWLDARIDRVLSIPRVRPEIRVWSAVPKGQRLSDMIEALSQAGARSWGALESARIHQRCRRAQDRSPPQDRRRIEQAVWPGVGAGD
jgi:16S rRNA (uracil1498-N3)-methyltransferase